jgi:hypothetical protein
LRSKYRKRSSLSARREVAKHRQRNKLSLGVKTPSVIRICIWIGVSEDVRHRSVLDEPAPEIYGAFEPGSGGTISLTLAIKTAAIRRAMSAVASPSAAVQRSIKIEGFTPMVTLLRTSLLRTEKPLSAGAGCCRGRWPRRASVERKRCGSVEGQRAALNQNTRFPGNRHLRPPPLAGSVTW